MCIRVRQIYCYYNITINKMTYSVTLCWCYLGTEVTVYILGALIKHLWRDWLSTLYCDTKSHQFQIYFIEMRKRDHLYKVCSLYFKTRCWRTMQLFSKYLKKTANIELCRCTEFLCQVFSKLQAAMSTLALKKNYTKKPFKYF